MKIIKSKKIIFYMIFFILAVALVLKIVGVNFLNYEIQVAEIDSAQQSITATGFIVRNEEKIEIAKNQKALLKYFVSDGERVSRHGTIAGVYAGLSDAKASYKIDNIDKEIEILEKLNLCKYNFSQSINSVNKKINEEIKNLLVVMADSKLTEISGIRDKILYFLNERQIILGKDVDFSGKINSLKSEKEKLASVKVISEIKSPESGDFVSKVDNYENVVDYKNVKSINFSDLNLDEIHPDVGDVDTCIGKIIKSSTWYVIFKIEEEKISEFSSLDDVTLSVDGLDYVKDIPAKIERVNKDSNSKDFIVLVSCDYMNEKLASLRKEEFNIKFKRYEDIRVKKKAIHQNKENSDEFGVYVVKGNYLKFKKVNPIFWSEEDVICAYEDSQISDEGYLQIGDKIIVGGKDVHEGKKI